MFVTQDRTLDVLDRAVSGRDHADRAWRSAIGQALANEVPIEQVATRARIPIDTVLAVVDDLYAQRAS